DGVDADNAAPSTNHPDLFVTDVAFDVVVSADVRVRHDWRLCCDRENLFKAGWIDVGKNDNHADGFSLMRVFATERCQPLSRRTAGREIPAVPRRIGSSVGEPDRAHTEFVKNAQLI